MIQFGTGGWRAIIGDGFTRENIRRIAAACGDETLRLLVKLRALLLDRGRETVELGVWIHLAAGRVLREGG